MTEVHPAALAKLVRSIGVLGLPFEGQAVWLSSLGLGEADLVDELALELGDGALLVGQFLAAGWLRPEAGEIIRELDTFLADRSGPAHRDFWTVQALRDEPGWIQVRELALKALLAI